MGIKASLFFVFSFLIIEGSGKLKSQTIERPKLVVGIVVDQMRHDYLYRYYAKYGPDGFKRILKEGFSCENLHYNYAPTVTAPGHASIYTGTSPAFHGIIGNEWHVRYSREGMYCVDDPNVSILGRGNPNSGKKSPVNLLANTFTDELRLFFHDRAKVIGISIKDRGSILPAGHHPTGAYWFDESSGQFVSSTYYHTELPAWLVAFNEERRPYNYLGLGWQTLRPIEEYTESMADLNPYEGKMSGEKAAVFPRRFDTISPNLSNITTSPHGNTLITDLGLRAIEMEGLGLDSITDVLALSYSSPDYAGHLFGPQAIEIEDIYLRLDLEIARLLKALDQQIGKNQYLVFISADHGVAQVPQLLKDLKYPADYFSGFKLRDSLRKIVSAKYDPYVIDGFSNHQIYLNENRIQFRKLNREKIVQDILSFIKGFPGVVDAFSREQIPFLSSGHPVNQKLRLGYFPPRSGDIIFYLMPNWMEWGSLTGTTHGSPYNYDTHVPALFYGWKVPAGKSYTEYGITDIAATICHLIKIPLPNASIGKPIEFVR
jgi:predicted AlkP superfamily pyrophosphatase or phosphodiesterase